MDAGTSWMICSNALTKRALETTLQPRWVHRLQPLKTAAVQMVSQMLHEDVDDGLHVAPIIRGELLHEPVARRAPVGKL